MKRLNLSGLGAVGDTRYASGLQWIEVNKSSPMTDVEYLNGVAKLGINGQVDAADLPYLFNAALVARGIFGTAEQMADTQVKTSVRFGVHAQSPLTDAQLAEQTLTGEPAAMAYSLNRSNFPAMTDDQFLAYVLSNVRSWAAMIRLSTGMSLPAAVATLTSTPVQTAVATVSSPSVAANVAASTPGATVQSVQNAAAGVLAQPSVQTAQAAAAAATTPPKSNWIPVATVAAAIWSALK